MIYLWHKAGRQKLPENCSLISKQFHFLHTYLHSNQLATWQRQEFLPFPCPLMTFFNLRKSSWAITHRTWDYTTFYFGFACTRWICSPMLNMEDKTSSASFLQFLHSYFSERPNSSVGSNNAPQKPFIETEDEEKPSLRTGTASSLPTVCSLVYCKYFRKIANNNKNYKVPWNTNTYRHTSAPAPRQHLGSNYLICKFLTEFQQRKKNTGWN